MNINPFSYGKPVDDIHFIGRQREIEQIYSRLLSAFESTSIVGERRIGKTSLLKIIANPVMQINFAIDRQKYRFIYQDFQFLDKNIFPTRFWKRVLQNIKRAVSDNKVVAIEIELALRAETIDNYVLDDIFMLMDEEELYIVLLLDEFDNVTRNTNFDSDFFGGLRALAIHHNLALVTSSRQELVELTHSETVRSSPFFNIFATVNLRAFSKKESAELIDNYLKKTSVKFLRSELDIIFAFSGNHPNFMQIACHHLFTAYQRKQSASLRQHYLLDNSYKEAAPIFKNYWRDSSPTQQILLTILALREIVDGIRDNKIEDLEHLYTRSMQVITYLERRTLVIKNQGSYHLFSTELGKWIANEIIGEVEGLQAWQDWQAETAPLIGKLPVTLQNLLSQIVHGLSPDYREVLGNWLIEPVTANKALLLIKNFLDYYEQETNVKHELIPTMAGLFETGDTPRKDIVNQPFETNPDEQATINYRRTTARISRRNIQKTIGATIATTERRLRRPMVSPIALGGLIISSIVTHLELEADDRLFVNEELKWLFSASDNFLKICRGEYDSTQAIVVPIPADAQIVSKANNCMLDSFDSSDLQFWQARIESRLKRIKVLFKDLDVLLDQEVNRGMAGKSDIELQNKLKNKRLDILRLVEEITESMDSIYGIRVTSPGQLVEIVEE